MPTSRLVVTPEVIKDALFAKFDGHTNFEIVGIHMDTRKRIVELIVEGPDVPPNTEYCRAIMTTARATVALERSSK